MFACVSNFPSCQVLRVFPMTETRVPHTDIPQQIFLGGIIRCGVDKKQYMSKYICKDYILHPLLGVCMYWKLWEALQLRHLFNFVHPRIYKTQLNAENISHTPPKCPWALIHRTSSWKLLLSTRVVQCVTTNHMELLCTWHVSRIFLCCSRIPCWFFPERSMQNKSFVPAYSHFVSFLHVS